MALIEIDPINDAFYSLVDGSVFENDVGRFPS